MTNPFAIGVSSHIISLALLGNYVFPLCLLMFHKLESSTSMIILNLECEIRSSRIKEEVPHDVAIAMTIICLDLIIANNTQYKNKIKFPYLLKPSIKKTLLAPKYIQSSRVEYAISCSRFKVVGACKSSKLMLKANSSKISLFSIVFIFGSVKSMSGKS